MSGESLITVRTGTAEPATVVLPPGQPLGPMSIGRRGRWPIVAPGVLEEHGFPFAHRDLESALRALLDRPLAA